MRTLLRRHTTLIAFALSLGASTAFVACGSDSTVTTPPGPDGSAGGGLGTGGVIGSGGASSGGRVGTGGSGTGGNGTGGISTGGTGSGGAPKDSGPDGVTSNGDAQTD